MNACFCDYEPAEFYQQARRRAKKEHSCSECGRAIDPGELYEHASGKWDGDVRAFKTCPRCLALKDWVDAHVPCSCWAHGNIIEDAIEAARAYSHEAPGLLFGAYRRQVAINRQRRAATRKEN
ncbi:hypothetical protein GCM10028811_12420 [Uliginosibacterium sediminicola]